MPATQTNGGVGDDVPAAVGDPAQAQVLPETALLRTGSNITIETDLFRVLLDTTGGDVRQADLLAYPATTEPGSPPFRLLNDSLPNLFIVQSGLRSSSGTEPTHHVVYSAEQNHFRMADDADE